MDKVYEGEEIGESAFFGTKRILYLGENEIQKTVARIESGLFVDYFGERVHSFRISDSELSGPSDGVAIALLDTEGNFYVSELYKILEFRHSSFVMGRGKSVRWAGTVTIDQGKLVSITDSSGHFKTSLSHTRFFLRWLKSSGVNLAEVRVHIHSLHKTFMAEELLRPGFERQLYEPSNTAASRFM